MTAIRYKTFWKKKKQSQYIILYIVFLLEVSFILTCKFSLMKYLPSSS